MNDAPVAEIPRLSAKQRFATDNSNVFFRKDTSFKETRARAALKEIHDSPQYFANRKRSIVPCYTLRAVLSGVDDFLLDFDDILTFMQGYSISAPAKFTPDNRRKRQPKYDLTA